MKVPVAPTASGMHEISDYWSCDAGAGLAFVA